MFLPISTKARRFYLSAVFGTMVLASAQQGLTQTNSFQLASQERQSPDVVVKRIELGDGSTSLANWRERAPARPSQRKMLIPRHPSYQGARLFYEKSMQPTPRAATEDILSMSGFRGAVYKAESSGNREFVRTIDGHPRSAITTFMYEGTLGGQPAKAIAYVWSGKAVCGTDPYCHTPHVFMAPNNQFKKLGGGAPIAIAWLNQDVPAGVNAMDKYGSLAPQEATFKLAQYVNTWMVGYIQTHIQMMQMMGQANSISQQVMQSMQSYNNALSQCYGMDCSISQGPGNTWSATID